MKTHGEKNYDKNNLTPTQKREAIALGGELRHKFKDATSIQAGYRSESSDKYETAQTWKLALLKPLTDNTNFRAFWYGTNRILTNALFLSDKM